MAPETIKFEGDFTNHPASAKLKTAFDDAIADRHNLDRTVLDLEGMSGYAYRKFINNLVRSFDDSRFLEIGVWKGSTTCAAIWGNKCKATAIDNWSDFGGPKHDFENNINLCKNDAVDFTMIEQDFRSVDYNAIGKYNIYMFDGPHSEQDQYDGVATVQPALDDVYIQIVDDWNNEPVQVGTRNAIDKLGLKILSEITVVTPVGHPHFYPWYKDGAWHNGYYMAVLQKT